MGSREGGGGDYTEDWGKAVGFPICLTTDTAENVEKFNYRDMLLLASPFRTADKSKFAVFTCRIPVFPSTRRPSSLFEIGDIHYRYSQFFSQGAS
jgi:hypothetical protein